MKLIIFLARLARKTIRKEDNNYMKGSDFSKVSPQDLLSSTSECFTISQLTTNDPNYSPVTEDEIRQLSKYVFGIRSSFTI
jgi:hypothetical protein